MTHPDPDTGKPGLTTAVWRGLRHRCPACGQGSVYRAYLKPVDACAVCGMRIGEIPSEDGPAWLTVLMLGPLLVAVTFFVSLSDLPLGLTLPLAGVVVTGAVLLLLPRIKAAFIAILWVSGSTGTVD